MQHLKAFASVVLFLAGYSSLAHADTLYPAKAAGVDAVTMTIYSSLDESIASALIIAFQQTAPDVAVNYVEAQSLDIYDRIIAETNSGGKTADLAISSAMDLQVKLANDGYAMPVRLAPSTHWPQWANWRSTAFALTYEPAAIVYHKPSFVGREPPQSHGDLQRFLASNANDVYGRIGTYDIERSGLGFLFLARDLEHYQDTWNLIQAMGTAGVKLYSTSSAILERVSDGRMALGYNILGSYAQAWAKNHPDLGIILPTDYTVVMSRIALVPSAARSHQLGVQFLEFLISKSGQEVLQREVGLPAIHPEVTTENQASSLTANYKGQLRPIPVTPSLVVYLDQVKRARVIHKWNEALQQR